MSAKRTFTYADTPENLALARSMAEAHGLTLAAWLRLVSTRAQVAVTVGDRADSQISLKSDAADD